MAYVCKLTDGTDEILLYYSTAEGFSLLDQGIKPGQPEPRTLYGGMDETQLVRHHDGRRQIPLDLYLKGSSDDDMLDRVNALQRMIKQARDFHLLNLGDEVFLEFQLDNASYASRFPVLSGEANIDRLMSLFCKGVQTIDSLPLVLTCEPYWESVATYTLKNYLGTPHFEEDGNSDGLADQWTELGTPATTLDTGIYLIGSQSQKVVTDTAGDDGIYSNVVSDTETSGVGYAWVYVASGDEVVVELYDADATTVKDTALYSEADWETKEGAGGYTWKRLVVSSSSLTSGNDHRLRIIRRTGDASEATTFYVDACYLELGTATTPIGWASCRDLFNHYDPDQGPDIGHIPYIDVAHIPGGVDAQALLDVKFDLGADNTRARILRFSARARGEPAKTTFWGEAEDSDHLGDWAAAVDAKCSGGNAGNGKVSNSGAATSGYAAGIIYATTSMSDQLGLFRAFARVRASSTTTVEVRASVYTASAVGYTYGEYKKVKVPNKWQLLDMGLLRVPKPRKGATLYYAYWTVGYVKAADDTVELDYLMLFPADERIGAIIVPSAVPLWVDDSWVTDVMNEDRYAAFERLGRKMQYATVFGSYLMLKPNTPNRIWFIADTHDGTDDVNEVHGTSTDVRLQVILKYRPRGVHLRGVE